jgi:7,8-dihydroneopterin aldolase/epimerase/oxygenase
MNRARSQIFLEGLAVNCRIGVPEEERATPQELWLDVELEVSVPFGQMQDDISQTVDYAELARELGDLAAIRPRRLIETLAADCVRHLLAYPIITRAKVRVRKKILPETDYVAVLFEECKVS